MRKKCATVYEYSENAPIIREQIFKLDSWPEAFHPPQMSVLSEQVVFLKTDVGQFWY